MQPTGVVLRRPAGRGAQAPQEDAERLPAELQERAHCHAGRVDRKRRGAAAIGPSGRWSRAKGRRGHNRGAGGTTA